MYPGTSCNPNPNAPHATINVHSPIYIWVFRSIGVSILSDLGLHQGISALLLAGWTKHLATSSCAFGCGNVEQSPAATTRAYTLHMRISAMLRYTLRGLASLYLRNDLDGKYCAYMGVMDGLLRMNLANPDLYTTLLDYPVLLLISPPLILLSATPNAPHFASCAPSRACTFRCASPGRPPTAGLCAANPKTFPVSTHVYCAAHIYPGAFKLRRRYNTLRDSNLSAFYGVATPGSANSP